MIYYKNYYKHKMWWQVIIDDKIYCYNGSIDAAIFSACRRHSFREGNYILEGNCIHGILMYKNLIKPKNISKAAFIRTIESGK